MIHTDALRRGRRAAHWAGTATLAVSALVLPVASGAAFAPRAFASTGISGQVQCVDELSVEGVWIQASSGGSGFASRTNINGYTQSFRYTLPNNGAWTEHVGCGGSSSKWEYSPDGNSTTTATSKSWTCITPDDGTGQNYCSQS